MAHTHTRSPSLAVAKPTPARRVSGAWRDLQREKVDFSPPPSNSITKRLSRRCKLFRCQTVDLIRVSPDYPPFLCTFPKRKALTKSNSHTRSRTRGTFFTPRSPGIFILFFGPQLPVAPPHPGLLYGPVNDGNDNDSRRRQRQRRFHDGVSRPLLAGARVLSAPRASGSRRPREDRYEGYRLQP